MAIQDFEREDLEVLKKEKVPSTFEIKTEPQKKMLKIVSLSPLSSVATFRHLESAETYYLAAKPTSAPAQQRIRIFAGLFGFPAPNLRVTLWDMNTGNKIAEATTNEDGIADITIAAKDPTSTNIVTGVGDRFPIMPQLNPFADIQPFTVWYIVVKATSISDRYARFIGRSIGEPLPHIFWREKPRTVIGILGIRFTFADLIPVFGTMSLRYEIGVSAWCSTPSPRPTHEECCRPEYAAWWDVKVYATNRKEEVKDVLAGRKGFVGGDKINLDYHLKYTITTTGITYDGRYLVKKRCAWEE